MLDQETSRTWLFKTPSRPDDPARAVLGGIRHVLDLASATPDTIVSVMHGTTVGTNTVVEGRGAKVGLGNLVPTVSPYSTHAEDSRGVGWRRLVKAASRCEV